MEVLSQLARDKLIMKGGYTVNKLNELDLANLSNQQVEKLKQFEQEAEFKGTYLIAVQKSQTS